MPVAPVAHHHLADLCGARYPIGLGHCWIRPPALGRLPDVTGPEGVELLRADGISLAVSGWELIATIVLFVLIYLVLFIAWARIVARFIKQGPTQEQPAPVAASSNSFMSGTPPAKAADASANDETAPAATKEGE